MTVWGIVCLINTYQTGVQLQTLPFNKMTERKEAMITQIRNVADVLTAGGSVGGLALSLRFADLSLSHFTFPPIHLSAHSPFGCPSATGYLPLSDGQTSFFALLSSIIFVQVGGF